MSAGAAFRGQPLLMLGILMLGWFGLRATTWQAPFEQSPMVARAAEMAPRPQVATVFAFGRPTPLDQPVWSEATRVSALLTLASEEPPLPVRAVAEFDLPPMVSLAQLQAPPAPGVPAAAPMLTVAPLRSVSVSLSRWSADAWLLLRRDTSAPFLAAAPSYGRAQAGAVLRYRLAEESGLRPQAYLRASTALAGAREQELAAGFSARPLAALPLRLAAEARVSETALGMSVRPAVLAITELPSLQLPLGVRAEAYAQGGYVGGEFATAFVDGQARAERPLVRRGKLELSAGAGAWGGAQRGAARLDVGPSATLSFRLGEVHGRVAADYRFRVAGRAEPASGPALTVSAGF